MHRKIIFAIGSLFGGGAERVVTVWANQLTERGFKVAVLLYYRTANEYPLSNRVKVYSCAESKNDYLELPYYKRYLIFRNIIKDFAPDYIIPFLFNMRLWMLMASIGLSVNRIETIRINPWVEDRSIGLFGRIVNRVCFITSYKIILQAQEQSQWLLKGDIHKAVLIPNPISEKYINIPEVSCSDFISEFIAVGRLDPQKNYPMMIEGFSQTVSKYPYIRLKIWGEGPIEYKEYLQSLIDSYHMSSNIFLMGRTDDISVEYLKSDVFVMTSDYEGSPNALIEAMACRLVCVSTDCVTGPKELIDNDRNGYLIPVGDNEALNLVLCRIIESDLETRKSMIERARDKILQTHSISNSVEILCKLVKGS